MSIVVLLDQYPTMELHMAGLSVDNVWEGLLNHPHPTVTLWWLDGPLHTILFGADTFEGGAGVGEQDQVNIEGNTVDEGVIRCKVAL